MATSICCMLFVGAIVSTSCGANDGFMELKTHLERLESKVTEQQETIETLTVKLEQKRDCKHSSERGTRKNRDITEGPVAFTAAIKPVTIDHMHSTQGVVFDSVVTNIGDGYNNATGVFVVPLTGIYVFSCSLLDHWEGTHGTGRLHAEIVQNGNMLVKVFAHSDTALKNNYRDQGSNTVFIKATKGDQFWVRVMDNPDLSLGGDFYSSFSGYMLWQM